VNDVVRTTVVSLRAVVAVVAKAPDHQLDGTVIEGGMLVAPLDEQVAADHLIDEGEVVLRNEEAEDAVAEGEAAAPAVHRQGVLDVEKRGPQDVGIIARAVAAAVEVAQPLGDVEGVKSRVEIRGRLYTGLEMRLISRSMAVVDDALNGFPLRWIECIEVGCMGR